MYNAINTRYNIQDVGLSHPETRTCLNRLLSPSRHDTRRHRLQSLSRGTPSRPVADISSTLGAVRGNVIVEQSPADVMASFSVSTVTKHEVGATFVFGPWLFIANQNGDLCREDRDDVAPTSGHPARITPRRPSIEFESNTISGSYPTRRSTWRPKRSPTPTREDVAAD